MPSSLLFEMDSMLPFGYETNVNLLSEKKITFINKELFQISNRDIIILVSQSQTIPYDNDNIGFPVCINGNELDIEYLYNNILDFFS